MMSKRYLLTGATVLILLVLTLFMAVSVLPAAPGAPTPTWPVGIDLPNKLPRIP